jgi:hypothetical protein
LTLRITPDSGTAGFGVLKSSTGKVVYSSEVQLKARYQANMDSVLTGETEEAGKLLL